MGSVGWQMGLLEDQEPRRLFSWTDMFMKILRDKIGLQRWERATEEERQHLNKLVDYYMWMELPQTREAIQSVLEAQEVEAGMEIVAALFTHPEVPSADTIARQKRQARENLKQAGLLTEKPPFVPDPKTFDELLSQFKPEGPAFSEHFIEAVLDRFRDLDWEQHKQITLPNGLQMTATLACPSHSLVIEVDTWKEHRSRERFSEDRLLSRELAIFGWTCLRFSGSELSVVGGFERALRQIARWAERRQAAQGLPD